MAVCALVGASNFNGSDFSARFARGTFDFVVAVDAGYAYLQDIGVQADVALGDFDSLGHVPTAVPVVKHPVIKDDSDMALAMDYAAGRGFDELYVYGGLGRRLDHTLANLQVFALYSERGLTVTAVDDSCVLRLLTGPGSFEIPARDSGTVSVFAACDEAVGVVETGMKYSLKGATLTNRTSLGLSNELEGKPARISVERGTLYIFYPLDQA